MVALCLSGMVGSHDTRERCGGIDGSFCRMVVSGGRCRTAAALPAVHVDWRLVSGVGMTIIWCYASTARLLCMIGHDSGTFAEGSRGAGGTRINGAQNRFRVIIGDASMK